MLDVGIRLPFAKTPHRATARSIMYTHPKLELRATYSLHITLALAADNGAGFRQDHVKP